MMKKVCVFTCSFMISLAISGCSSTLPAGKVGNSYLLENKEEVNVTNAELITANNTNGKVDIDSEFRFVPPLKLSSSMAKKAEDVLSQFNDEKSITLSSDGLPLADYLHYVLGEQLNVSYILSDEINADSQPVTLNIKHDVSARKLFSLTEELLRERDYIIRFDDNVFYIHKVTAKSNKGDVVYGYGKSLDDVPNTSLDIIQMVPFEYGMQPTLPNTLKLMLGIKAYPDQKRNTIMIKGKRKEILKALDFVQIVDKPNISGRQIGIYKLAYLQTSDLVKKLTDLMKQEGITIARGGTTTASLSIVELEKQGQIIFFAANKTIIERAVYWAEEIDKPVYTAEKQYFIYQPKYSRAVDLGDSLTALIGTSGNARVGSSTTAEAQNSNNTPRVRSASSGTTKLVVDERANAIIFFTSGAEYQQILPLIKRLDIEPKQIILEVTIAEVTLTDTFKSGVEFALTNNGAAKSGGFNLTNKGETGLSYILSGTRGQITANLLQTNNNVNVISRPSLVVRDGVTANINVGNDIPTVGNTVVDDGVTTSSVVYRKTGVELSVTPTINARGIVIMDIQQSISTQAEADSSVAGSPIIFERNIKTEVIAQSGQSILLGGLISENHSINDTSVPFFSDIPILGKLFDSKNDSKDRTELVVLVTPKVVESSDEWDDIKAKFKASLETLDW